MKYRFIDQVAVLASSSCNLNCSYCYLHDQHKGDAYSLLNEKIQQAWKDGTYVKNIKEVFKTIQCDPSKVTHFSFWGGEPLISLENLLPSVKELFKFFNGLTFCMIPTNWTIINNLDQFLLLIDEALIELDSKQKLTFHLQLSIDGPPGIFNSSGHPGDWDKYRKNIDILFQSLALTPFKKLRLLFEVHPTATMNNILNNLNTYDKIKEYNDYLQDFMKYINDKTYEYNINDFCYCGQALTFPVIAVPDKISVKDGMDLDSIINLSTNVQIKEYELKEIGERMYYHSLHNFMVKSIAERNPLCTESGLNGLTILYDGTICDCPCSYIQTFPPYLEQTKNNPKRQNDYKLALLRQPYFINPLTATDKEKEKFDWYMLDAIRDTKTTQISLAIALCQELALSGQINYNYFVDPELLLKTLYTIGNIYSCPREQVAALRNSFLSDHNDCKKLLNGAAETILRDRKSEGIIQYKGVLECQKNMKEKISSF